MSNSLPFSQLFLWNTTMSKKIKIKEIREYNVVFNKDTKTYDVNAFGGFGGGVTLFTSCNEQDCVDFINQYTEPAKKKVSEEKENADGLT